MSTGIPQERPDRRWRWGVAVAFHLLLAVVPYAGTGLVAPPVAVAGLWAAWLVGGVLLWRLRDRPSRALWVPVAAGLLWVAVVSLGDVALGWTA